jgi:hypothetical protein
MYQEDRYIGANNRCSGYTLVWREFSACTKTMREVALDAIAAVCRLQTVYVMDIHKQTYLFPFPIFLQVIHLLTKSSIFAINIVRI